jgi:hypothetical protein
MAAALRFAERQFPVDLFEVSERLCGRRHATRRRL